MRLLAHASPHGHLDCDTLARIHGLDLAAGTLELLIPDYQPVEFAVSAVYPHRRYLSTKLRCFIDLLALRFADHRRWPTGEAGIEARAPAPDNTAQGETGADNDASAEAGHGAVAREIRVEHGGDAVQRDVQAGL